MRISMKDFESKKPSDSCYCFLTLSAEDHFAKLKCCHYFFQQSFNGRYRSIVYFTGQFMSIPHL